MAGHPAWWLSSSEGPRPQLRGRDGVPIVTWRWSRVNLHREAWEMLPSGGILRMRVTPTHRQAFALALTPEELEAVFGEVRSTENWESHRWYHFPKDPPAISVFRVVRTGGAATAVSVPR